MLHTLKSNVSNVSSTVPYRPDASARIRRPGANSCVRETCCHEKQSVNTFA
jgi:hypothetical protein